MKDCLKCKGCEHDEKGLVKHVYNVLIINDQTGKGRVERVKVPSASFIPVCLELAHPERIAKIRSERRNGTNVRKVQSA